MQEYVYKVTHKFVKKPELLAQFGFNPYTDEDGEVVIAKPLILPFDCGIVKNTKRLFERFYKEATDEEKEKVFDMFYTGGSRSSDSRRSLGLGLALCRSIITSHGGTISVSDNIPNGTVVSFTLPIGEVDLNE